MHGISFKLLTRKLLLLLRGRLKSEAPAKNMINECEWGKCLDEAQTWAAPRSISFPMPPLPASSACKSRLSLALNPGFSLNIGGGETQESPPAEQAIPKMNFVAIDFETANYQPNSACAVGVVKVADAKIVDKALYLIKPPTRDFRFTYIHGLTWRDVAKEADFGEIWAKLDPFLAGAEFLAAHNASFDRRVLKECCATFGITMPSLPFQCTVQVARRTWGIRPTKLSDVCERLSIELNHHEALSDAMACAKIMIAAASGLTPTGNQCT